MVLRFFGLHENPFGVTPEPRFMYDSPTHREALASLHYSFRCNRGFTALIASPGLGKTTLLYRFVSEIRESARTVFLFDIDRECSPRELIASILRDLGITPDATATGMHEQLNQVLLEESRAGRTVVVVIDEAQNLSEAALETVRLLSNFETAPAKLIHIVLSGQPQLLEKLMQPSLVQLRQRISTFCHIDPLSAQEVCDYIHHRVRLAGHSGAPLFSDEALQLIAQASQGTPRIINNLCFNALSICRALNQSQVNRSMVEEAITDLRLTPFEKPHDGPAKPPSSGSFLNRPAVRELGFYRHHVATSAAALCFSIFIFVGFWEIRVHQPSMAPRISAPSAKIVPISTPIANQTRLVHVEDSKSTQQSQPFKITVGPNQTLRDIAVQYLGEFNETRLRQIRALNPSMEDPDYLLVGQSIWLPGPQSSNLAKSEMNSPDARSLP